MTHCYQFPACLYPAIARWKPWVPTSLDKSYGINSTFAWFEIDTFLIVTWMKIIHWYSKLISYRNAEAAGRYALNATEKPHNLYSNKSHGLIWLTNNQLWYSSQKWNKQSVSFLCSASPAIARVYHASREQRRAVQGIGSFQRNCLMATLTTGVVLLRWQLLSAVMMFLASTLNIRFRRSDYVGLAVISSGLGVVSACWFAMGLLGITMADITAIWHNIESVMIEEMNQTPPQWPMILTWYVEASITEASFLWLADALIIHLKTI